MKAINYGALCFICGAITFHITYRTIGTSPFPGLILTVVMVLVVVCWLSEKVYPES